MTTRKKFTLTRECIKRGPNLDMSSAGTTADD